MTADASPSTTPARTTGRPLPPEGDGPAEEPGREGLSAAERLALEQEVRRLRHELRLRDDALAALAARLQDAEREAHTATSKVTEAVRSELAAWQDRCHEAEAELARLRHSVVERVAQPVRDAVRLGRKAPQLAKKLSARLDGPVPDR